MEIDGKRALVLGGTSGIGLAAVRMLAAAGAEVTAAGRSAERVRAAQAAVGNGVDFRQVDVLDRDGLTGLFSRLAPLDILITCAVPAGREVGPFPQMDLDGFQRTFDKFWGYLNAVRLGLEHMTVEGSIVLVSGFPARKCPPGMTAIATVGNAVEGFVRAVAPEIAPRRINAVSPGTIDTPMFGQEGQEREAFFAEATAGRAIPRAGTADEVAEAILFLVGNGFTTGTVVDVDGGALLP